jgi:pyruvate dehydrogenase complex dehydrogenase (E1) component
VYPEEQPVTQTSDTVTWLTQEAYDQLRTELEYLSGPARTEIAKKIEAAREEGDLKENAGYHAAKEEQGKQEARVRQLTQLLENAKGGEAPADTGVVAPEAIEAVGLLAEDRPDTALLAVTSADRLYAGWTAAGRARQAGIHHAMSHVERLLAAAPAAAGLVTVIDGHPAALGWLGSVSGHKTRSLGVERFGQTGTIADLYRHFEIDARGIIAAAAAIVPGRPVRYS